MTLTPLTPEQRHRVERCTRLVEHLARTIAPRVNRITEEELRSVGYEALVRSSQRYDPERGHSFRTFAYHRVRGAMLDASRRAVPGLRQRTRALRSLEATQSLLEQVRQREPGDGPDPRRLEQRVAVVAELVAQTTAVVMLSNAFARDPEAIAGTSSGDLDAVLDEARTRDRLQAALDQCCTEDERAIVMGLYQDGLTMAEIGERLGMHKSTVSRRHSTVLRRLSKALAES